ncbi:MAG: DUF981 domain-containing protein, partial [Actinomycetota bacterium]|nr:DUF981 domain-containing protein [Actinomycetota bacterium]
MFNPDPVYNTIMSVGAGVALLLLVALGRRVVRGESVHRQAWAAPFIAIGVILTLTGAHMSLTWPLSGPTAFDNIVFGEPVFAMGVILIAGGYLLGSERFLPAPLRNPGETINPAADSHELGAGAWPHLAKLFYPLSWFGAAMG